MKKQSIVVTGSAAGIGFAIATYLNELGYNVVGIDKDLSKEKYPGTLYNIDLLDKEKTAEVLKEIFSKFEVFGVVNNVAMNVPESIYDITYDIFKKTIDLNDWTAIQVAQAAARYFREKKVPGRIVNIASTAIQGIMNRSAYSASKGALQTLTKTWALELAPLGVTVNTIAPGAFDTDLFRQLNPPDSEKRKAIESAIPLGRIGNTFEIAKTVAYFLSDGANYTTGQTLYVDGGISVGIKVYKPPV